MRFGGRLVLAGQPFQVVAERPARGQLGGMAGGERGVAGEHVGEDLEHTPPVQQQVVERPHHLYLGPGQPGDGQPQQ